MLIDEGFYGDHPDWGVKKADHGVVYPGVFFRHGNQAIIQVISGIVPINSIVPIIELSVLCVNQATILFIVIT